jgi:hypothetical protein
MLDRKSAARLLGNKWADPSSLARELYSIVVGGGDRVIESPVVFEIPRDAPPLIVRRSTSPQETTRGPAQSSSASILSASQAATEGPSVARPASPTDASRGSSQEPIVGRAKSSILSDPFRGTEFSRKPRQPPPQTPSDVSSPSIRADIQGLLASRFPPPSDAPGYEGSPSGNPSSGPVPTVPSGTKNVVEGIADNSLFKPTGRASDFPTSPLYKPRDSSPVPPQLRQPDSFRPDLSVLGPAEFKGAEASRFDVEPKVYNPPTADYRPITEWVQEQIARIRRPDYGLTPLVAKVLSGTGKKWKATVYQLKPDVSTATGDVKDPTARDVDLIVLNSDDNTVAPVGSFVGPVIELTDPEGAADNNFFLILDPWRPGHGTVTAAVSAASGETPGTGTIMEKTWTGSGDKTAVASRDVFNDMPSVISVGTVVEFKWINGRRFIDVAACP